MIHNINTDLLLISCPSKVMDYPCLSLPALTGYLKNKDIDVSQVDLNIEVKDALMTEKELLYLHDIVMPLLIRLNKGHENYNKLKSTYEMLSAARVDDGFRRIEEMKCLCQRREFDFLQGIHNNWEFKYLFSISKAFDFLFEVLIQYEDYFKTWGINYQLFEIVDELLEEIRVINPKAIGLTMITTQNKFTLWFSHCLRKKIKYGGSIIIGGAQPTKFEEKYLVDNESIDFIVPGEGEVTIYLLMKQLIEGSDDFDNIPRLIYRYDGVIKKNKNEKYLQDSYESSFPSYEGFPLDKYLSPVLPVLASSNCPWKKCKFCAHKTAFREEYRERNYKDVVDEMEYMYEKYGTTLFHFADETITANQGSGIGKYIEERLLPFMWMSFGRLDDEFTYEHLKQWYEGGARVIEWGLESGSNYILDNMTKGITVEKAQEILHAAGKIGMKNKLLTWHNYPGETLSDLNKTMTFVNKNVHEGFASPMFTLKQKLVLQVGSDLYRECINDKNDKYFDKVWLPASEYSINAKYYNKDNNDSIKMALIDGYFKRLHEYCDEQGIFIASNENITFDLLICEQKGELAYE